MANNPVPPKGPPTNLRPAGVHKDQNAKKEEPRSLVKRKLAALLAEIAEGP